MRLIARRLRPEALDELGLQSALLALCTASRSPAGIEVERRFERDLPLTSEEELVIYRVAQESLDQRRPARARPSRSRSRSTARRGRVLVVATTVSASRRGRERLDGHPRHARACAAGRRQLELRAVEPHGTEVSLHLPAKEAA